jgi:hypothetical protein
MWLGKYPRFDIKIIIKNKFPSEQNFNESLTLNMRNPIVVAKKNPLADNDIAECIAALAGLMNHPERSEDVKEHILDALEAEGLWNYETGVSAKGKKFLRDAGVDEDEDYS